MPVTVYIPPTGAPWRRNQPIHAFGHGRSPASEATAGEAGKIESSFHAASPVSAVSLSRARW